MRLSAHRRLHIFISTIKLYDCLGFKSAIEIVPNKNEAKINIRVVQVQYKHQFNLIINVFQDKWFTLLAYLAVFLSHKYFSNNCSSLLDLL